MKKHKNSGEIVGSLPHYTSHNGQYGYMVEIYDKVLFFTVSNDRVYYYDITDIFEDVSEEFK